MYAEPYTTSYPTATSYCYYYECANGDCVLGDRCDNYDDCRDNSDEDGCGMFSVFPKRGEGGHGAPLFTVFMQHRIVV